MGIYDRDYYRDDNGGRGAGRKRSNGGLIPAGWSASAILIAANVLLFLANSATADNALFNKMALFGLVADQPAQWYRCLTYGFAH
ncbi:MAG: hypothetical protein IIW01_02220, partial [Thermoguttaceae bacterium]|nr:hypothetical protein [Thermoguttaceae bacterium]